MMKAYVLRGAFQPTTPHINQSRADLPIQASRTGERLCASSPPVVQ